MNSGGFRVVFLFTSNNKSIGKLLISERYLIMGGIVSSEGFYFRDAR